MSSSSSSYTSETSSESSSLSSFSSNSFSSLSSDTTLSSDTSTSSSSQSSISSESSAWDHGPWWSICHLTPVTARRCYYHAMVIFDLRHSDAVIASKVGPLVLDIGGTWGETTVAPKKLCIVDGYILREKFNSVADAHLWQQEIYARVAALMEDLRLQYHEEFPGGFEKRHRRV